MTTEPYIGMPLWQFNENRRVYERDSNGQARGGPIWREHWEPVEILGETSRSWLVGSSGMKTWSDLEKRVDKLAKREFPGDYATSQEDIDRRAFVHARHELCDRAQNCRDYDTLKAIEAALDALPK